MNGDERQLLVVSPASNGAHANSPFARRKLQGQVMKMVSGGATCHHPLHPSFIMYEKGTTFFRPRPPPKVTRSTCQQMRVKWGEVADGTRHLSQSAVRLGALSPPPLSPLSVLKAIIFIERKRALFQ